MVISCLIIIMILRVLKFISDGKINDCKIIIIVKLFRIIMEGPQAKINN